MKKITAFLATLLLLSFISCKKECYRSAIVVKDCTGTYLQMDGKDYKICNREKLASYTDGTRITFTYKEVSGCSSEKEEMFCSMLHPTEGWMEVQKID
ncbi:MAG: hypothetical protein PSX36_14070 [bacterium]|nr:hypothetical protein [bacterium]